MKNLFQRFAYLLISFPLFLFYSCQQNGGKERIETYYSDDTTRVKQLLDSFHFYMDSNIISRTFPFTEQAFAIAEKNNYADGMADALNCMGRYYSSIGDHPKAMDCQLKSLSLNEKNKNELRIARNYSDIGIIHYNQKNYTEAIQYYNKAVKLYQKLGSERGMAIHYYLMGLSKAEQGIDAEALDYFFKSLKIQRKLADRNRIPELELAIGDCYLKRNELSEALQFYDSAAKHFTEVGETMGVPSVNLSLAELFLKRNEPDKAEKYALSANKYFIKIKYGIRILDSYQKLQKIYTAKNDFKNAYNYQNKVVALKDSILGEENTKKLSAMQSKFELDKKQTEIELGEKKIKIQRTLRNVFMAGFAIVAILAFLTFRQYRIKNITAKQLEETLQNLKAAQEQLVYTEKMSSLGKLSAGIAHEIQNPLNFVNNFSDMGVNLIDELETTNNEAERKEILTDLKRNMQKIHEHGKRADGIVKSMLDHTHVGSIEKRPTDLNYLANEFFTLAFQSFKAREPGFDCQVEKLFENNLPLITINPQDISRVMINLFNNALYALHKKTIAEGNNFSPSIVLQSRLSDKRIYFSVRDNGTGIPKDIREKIFQSFFTTKPTGEGTGLGLSLSQDIIAQGHGGTLEMKSTEGEGSEFIISLPA